MLFAVKVSSSVLCFFSVTFFVSLTCLLRVYMCFFLHYLILILRVEKFCWASWGFCLLFVFVLSVAQRCALFVSFNFWFLILVLDFFVAVSFWGFDGLSENIRKKDSTNTKFFIMYCYNILVKLLPKCLITC